MQKAIRQFLVAALVLTIFLLVVSIVFLARSSNDSDADSMMLAFLLLAFSAFTGLILGIIIWKLKKDKKMAVNP